MDLTLFKNKDLIKKYFIKYKKVFTILFVIILIGIYFYFNKENENQCLNLPPLEDGKIIRVTKVIDGDTFLIEGGYSVRILGIDADEKGYPCYDEAKERLEELILNKEVRLEKGGKEDFDKYCRYLRYPFVDNKNVSLELLKEGLVVARLSGEEKYKNEIINLEKEAKEKKIGCKWADLILNEKEASNLRWENLTKEKTGLNVINACEAKNYYGKEAIVEGRVVDTYRSKSETVFLNFEKPYPNQCFTGVIFKSKLDLFKDNPEDYYFNKTIRIMGKIKDYKGRAEIILEDPAQIEIGK